MKRLFAIALILFAAVAIASAAGPGPRGPRHGPGGPGMWGGPLWEASLFRPDFVLQNQSQIGLTDAQILAITKDVGATHDKLRAQRDTMKGLTDQLRTLLDAPQVDEKAALALASQLMDAEKQMKTAHMGLMIRVKNQLTPEQQQKLKDLRPARPPLPPEPPDAPEAPEPDPSL
jgi:Spy/CpxP family protein refolding chaperone